MLSNHSQEGVQNEIVAACRNLAPFIKVCIGP